jgi:Effector Associated Constant Component 1
MSDGSIGSFELALEPRSGDYQPDDDRWRDQVVGLVTELHRQVDVERRSAPVEGTKGTLDELVVALGTAGAFTAIVECLRAWLGRDRSRRVDVRWNENGKQRYVTLTGDAIDVDSVREIAKAAAHRVGGSGWPASTAPS